MIKAHKFEDLGHHDYGWLNARYHFSFGSYHNPERMGYGALRVINDDIVQSGRGFATHGHDNMEIITYVRAGAITHKDSQGNEGRTEAGDVQVMSAGTGIEHSEHNHEKVETNLYQIWILPREKNIAPRWDARQFPKDPVNTSLAVLASGYEAHKDDGALWINADAAIYGGRLQQGKKLTHELKDLGYLLVSEGDVSINGQSLKKGDGASIEKAQLLEITANTDAEIVLIDVAT